MYPVLETKRLRLVPLRMGDFNDISRFIFNPRVFVTMEHDDFDTPESYKHDFPNDVKNGEYYTLRDKESDCFIGFIALHQYIKRDKVEYSQIWTAILPEYWGRGFCTEAAERVLHFAFLGVKTPWVCANQFQTNPAAGNVLKKCGFNYYTTYKMRNRPYDQYRYKIEEYLADKHLQFETDVEYNYTIPVRVSPYNYSNPVRKIDYIKYIKEPTGYLCGQSVVAMLAGVSVTEVIEVMGTDKGTSTPVIREALKYYGLKTATKARLKYMDGTGLPDCCILSVKMPGYGHWSLYYKGNFYDPEFGILDKLPADAKLCYYWQVEI